MASISRWHGPRSGLGKKWYMVNKRRCEMKERGRQKEREREKEIYWNVGQEGRTAREASGLSLAPLNNVLICVFKLCGRVRTVFSVHTHTQLRAATYRVFCLGLYGFLYLQINFPSLYWNIPWFMGSMKVKHSWRAELPDQIPFRSKLVVALISHLEILIWICVHSQIT